MSQPRINVDVFHFIFPSRVNLIDYVKFLTSDFRLANQGKLVLQIELSRYVLNCKIKHVYTLNYIFIDELFNASNNKFQSFKNENLHGLEQIINVNNAMQILTLLNHHTNSKRNEYIL